MSPDSYREVSSRSWGNRIGGSFKGIVIGLILIAVAVGLLFWNEGRAVLRYKTLKEGGGAVVSVDNGVADPGHDGKLVHVAGRADSKEKLRDPVFGVEANAIRLVRRVEMYQWLESRHSETRKKLGGGEETVTTYTYEPGWSERLSDSRQFKKPEGHANPPTMAYQSSSWLATQVQLGGFLLPRFLTEKLTQDVPLELDGAIVHPDTVPQPLHQEADGFYLGDDPRRPKIGDMRIAFRQILPTDVSIISQQLGNSFVPYQTSVGGTIALLEPGIHPAAEMFASAQRSNTVLTWVIRAGGFLIMSVGFTMILAPLVVVADVVPAIGSLLGIGTKFVAGTLAGVVTLLTIGLAWLYYRPLLGIIFLSAAAGLIFLVFFRAKKSTPVMPPPLPKSGG